MTRVTLAAALLLLAASCKRSSDGNAVRTAAVGDAAERALNVTAADLAAIAPDLSLKPDAGTLRRERTQSGRVEVDYEYDDGSLTLASSLNLETSAANADRFYDEMLSEVGATLAKIGLSRRDCDASEALTKVMAWGKRGRCDEILHGEEMGGLSLALERGERVYLLTLFSPAAEGLEPGVLELVGARLDRMAAYAP